MINKGKFIRYKILQIIGVTNMLDYKRVSLLTGITKDDIQDIQENYNIYCHKFDMNDLPTDVLIRELLTYIPINLEATLQKQNFLINLLNENQLLRFKEFCTSHEL